jgi:hypothetical protein
MDIQDFDPDSIPDIRDINIDIDKSALDRILDYINQAQNPYFIRHGKILVKIEHSETETTIEDCMEGYFRSLC